MKYAYLLVLVAVVAVYGQDSGEFPDVELVPEQAQPVETTAVAPESAAPAAEDGAGSVDTVNGTVTATAGTAKRELQKYDVVADGDVITTPAGAAVLIRFRDDRAFVYVDSDSTVTIDYAYSSKYNAHKVNIILDRGQVRVGCRPVNDMRSNVTVITPNASVGTTGGDMTVRYLADSTYVFNYGSGVVAVKHLLDDLSSLGKVFLYAGNKLQVSTRKGLSHPGEIKDTENDRTFWSELGVSSTFGGGTTQKSRQDQLIDREIRRAASDRIWPSAFDLAR